jgi:hypothetical protein
MTSNQHLDARNHAIVHDSKTAKTAKRQILESESKNDSAVLFSIRLTTEFADFGVLLKSHRKISDLAKSANFRC